MKIGIVGHGYVGHAVEEFFKGHHEVIWYDPYQEGSCQKDDINLCDLAVVCVFTPTGSRGECDVSIVEEVVNWITTPLILIKSTVAIGTVERLRRETGKRIVFSPEYIGEGKYDAGIYNFNRSMRNHSFYIFGGDPKDTRELVNIFTPIGGPTRKYFQTDATTAEIVKYAENGYFATKLTFCYELNQICEAFGSDYNTVRELWLADPRINCSHTSVFQTQAPPFDGKCLPKDLKALVCSAEEQGYLPELLKEVLRSCDRIREIREK